MILFRGLVALAAISFLSTSASALTIEECRAKYRAEKATGTNERAYSWVESTALRLSKGLCAEAEETSRYQTLMISA